MVNDVIPNHFHNLMGIICEIRLGDLTKMLISKTGKVRNREITKNDMVLTCSLRALEHNGKQTNSLSERCR